VAIKPNKQCGGNGENIKTISMAATATFLTQWRKEGYFQAAWQRNGSVSMTAYLAIMSWLASVNMYAAV